jgi:hypothetical protein
VNKLHLLCFCALFFATSAFAESKSDIFVKDINLTLSAAPSYELQASPKGKSLPRQDTGNRWVLIEAELDSKLDWADEVQVKFYVVANYSPGAFVEGAVASKLPNDQQYNILTTTVSIVNMPKSGTAGRKNIVPVFIDPNTVKKYGGEGNLQKFIPEVVVEVMYKGVLQDRRWKNNEKGSGNFWEKKQPKPGVLLNLLQSPWWPAYSDYYERVKPLTVPSF